MPGNGSYIIHRFRGEAAEEHVRRKKGPERGFRRCRFSIGSAPLTSITESDAQISGGETRQDLKIPGVSPWWLPRALSCSCLSVYRCHSAVMAAFISFHAWHSVPGRQFAPSWTVCTNPPFSPTAAPVPVTIDLSPTRKDTTKRHWQQPLVTWFADDLLAKHEVALEVCASVRLHWKDRFGCCALRKPVTTVQKLAGLLNLRKNHLAGWFFRFQTKRLRL